MLSTFHPASVVLMKRFMVVLFCAATFSVAAQEVALTSVEEVQKKMNDLENQIIKLNKLKVSGFIQTQYQYAEAAADGVNFKLAKGINAYENSATDGNGDYKGLSSFSRFGIRRGFLKFTYDEGLASGVAQIDITDKGLDDNGRNVVMVKDLYFSIKDPWYGTCFLKTGLFDPPFGYEIAYSSSRLESPERARIIQSILPDERDVGTMITLQPAKTSNWNFLKLDAGFFAGNGIKPQIDSHIDFIGHLSATKNIGSNRTIGGGISAYLGGVRQMNDTVYRMDNQRFVAEASSANNGKFAKRQYIGFDLQFSMTTSAGWTQLRGEYIFGEHPGNSSGAYNFRLTGLQSGPVFMRKIRGGYVILVQEFGQSPFSAVLKYDWYNPNTDISGNAIASQELVTGAADKATNTGDITKSNFGVGLLWRINAALRLTAYYDFVGNEKTQNIANQKDDSGHLIAYGYEGNRKDNVFTLRLQYRF